MQRTAALLLFVSLAKAAASQIVINEVGIAPSGGAGSQFTELFNRGGCAVDLSCYTLVFSSTSGGGNPTGWTVKVPSGKSIAAGGYFLIGGTAGVAGVSGGTGYPTGGVVNSYVGAADVNVGTTAITANAVYMKQFLAAGSFTNTKGQLSLLDATGSVVASVSYNNGNDAGSYPLSAYTTCASSGNMQGVNNVLNPGTSVSNVSATFSAITNQGIYLSNNGTYLTETSLTPGTSNTGNGGTQLCSGPVLNTVSNLTACFDTNNQTVILPYTGTGTPVFYSLGWSGAASLYFSTVTNAAIGSNIFLVIPGNVPPGIYTGYLTVANTCGSSCTKPFLVTVNALPTVSAGNYASICVNSSPLPLTGMPAGGTFSGANVLANNFIPPNTTGNYTVTYSYTDAVSGCANNASVVINVSAPASTYTTACTSNAPFVFFGQSLTATGLHTALLNNAAGCTDTARIYLVVKQVINVDTAACDSVMYNGVAYYNNTTLMQAISSTVTACDSIVKNVQVRIKKRSTKDTTICVGVNGSFALLGQTFTASGNYVLQTTNADGCDSLVRLHLTVATTQTQVHSGCDSVVFNGQHFYASTNFIDTLYNGFGCDSLIRTHNVIVHHTSHTYIDVCLAAGQTYNFSGQVLNTSGNYSTVLNGIYCDSVVHLHLLIAQPLAIVYQGCNNYAYNGVVYTSSTSLRDTLRSALGCDSILRTIQIVIAPILHTYVNACIQQGQTYLFDNQVLTTGGSYTAQFKTQGGCDSMVHLYLTIAAMQMQNIKGCDSLIWKGQVYHATTQVTDTMHSLVSGCDSLYDITNLIITASPVKRVSICLAAGQSYLFNGQTLSASGQYTAVFVRPGFCDSTVQLSLVIPLIQQQRISGCGMVTYNNVTYTSPVVLQDTVRGITLCDSIYRIIQITVLPAVQTFATACINQGQSYNFNGQTLTAGGYYTTTYQTAGCDSTVSLYLLVAQTKTQIIQGCDSVLYNGKTYYLSAVVRDTTRSLVSACDSIISITTLIVRATKHRYISACLPPGQTYSFNGQLLSSTGTYQAVYTTNACDSIVHLYLLIATQGNLTLHGCNSVVYNGTIYTSSAIVRDTVKSLVTSCDSLYRETSIVISPLIQTSITACIAPGSGYSFNGQLLTAGGIYTANFATAAGCDSVVYLYLSVSKLIHQSVSGCDSVFYKGQLYGASTIVTDTIKSVITQCDSIINTVVITVNKKPEISVSRDTIICRWGSATLNASAPGAMVNWSSFGSMNLIVVSPQSTTQYFVTAVDTAGCKNTKTVTVSVQDFSIALRADVNPSLSGTNVFVQSSGNYFYSVAAWQPANLFSNQTGKSQHFAIDTTVIITTIGQSSLGCKDTATLQLTAIPLDDVYIPSAFTPNGDGRNDEVKVMGTAIKELTFTVFNRWGHTVFYTADKGKGWNGKFNGAMQPAGTYVYIARVIKTNGRVVEKKGTVTLIK